MVSDTNDVILKANALANDIRDSILYKNYCEVLNLLKQDEALVKKVAYFKKENVKYRTKILQKINTCFDEEKYVSSLYTELMLIKTSRDFLESESKILDLLSKTLNAISSSCQLEFEIFEKE